MKSGFLKIHYNDNVFIAIDPLKKNELINVNGLNVKILEDIPGGHKIALKNIGGNENILKYGHVIGHAVIDIPAGSWVHSHNIKTNLNEIIEYSYNPVESKPEKIHDNLKSAISALKEIDENTFTQENIKNVLMSIANTLESRGELLHPVRYALSGLDKSPDPFIIAEILGKNETLSRLQKVV